MSFLVRDIAGNRQRLDGGAMFGNVPRALWSQWATPDEQGRIELACRAALVEYAGQRVLLETGVGTFFEPKLKARFGVVEDEHVLLRSLGEHGLSHTDIDVVVLSHLHFDHAGGLLAPYVAGSKPELLFPNARFVVGQTAFERALHPHPRDRASFIPELPELLSNSGRLELVPEGAQHAQCLGQAFHFVVSHGHTPGMLHTWLRGERQELFFCADLVPGRAWVHVPVTMGYDRYAEALIDEKAQLFPDFVARRTWLFFTHDVQVAAARVNQSDTGRFVTTEEQGSLAAGLDLD